MKPLELADITFLRENGYKSIVLCCSCSEGQNPLIYGRMELHPFKKETEANQFLKALPAPKDPHDAPYILDIDDAELEEMKHEDGNGIEFFIKLPE